jgi:hypothetical protein
MAGIALIVDLFCESKQCLQIVLVPQNPGPEHLSFNLITSKIENTNIDGNSWIKWNFIPHKSFLWAVGHNKLVTCMFEVISFTNYQRLHGHTGRALPYKASEPIEGSNLNISLNDRTALAACTVNRDSAPTRQPIGHVYRHNSCC